MPKIGDMIWPTQHRPSECPEWMDHLDEMPDDDREPFSRCTSCGEPTSACECSA